MRWQKGARRQKSAVTRIRTGVAAATTQSTNHYTITAHHCPTTAKRASGVFVRCRERAEKHARDVIKRYRRFSSACRQTEILTKQIKLEVIFQPVSVILYMFLYKTF